MADINAKRFSKVMRELARVQSRASAGIARELNKAIQRNFDRGVDPYGRRWRKLAKKTLKKGRRWPPLTDTGHGREGVIVKPGAGAGLVIVVRVLYMIYHQFGGSSHLRGPGGNEAERYANRRKHRHFGRDADRSPARGNPPKRSFLPFERMPSEWERIVFKQIERAAKRIVRRAGA